MCNKLLPFEDKLNILALDSKPDLLSSPTMLIRDNTDIENAPVPRAPLLACNPQPHQTRALLQLDGPDASVKNCLKELCMALIKLKKQFKREMQCNNMKTDPRNPANIQALFDYCVLAEQLVQEGIQNPEMSASLQIACTKVSTVTKEGDVISKGAWYARTLRSKARHVRELGQLPTWKQGKGGAHKLLLDNPLVSKAVEAFVGKAEVGKVTPHLLMVKVNTRILPPLMLSKSTISKNTAKSWLLQLGSQQYTYKKGIYMDGHEQPNVVMYQTEFLNEVAKHKLLVLLEEEIKAHRALPKNKHLKTWDACKIIYPGKNQDPYWDMPQLVTQIKEAIKIFEVKFLGAQMLLFVDQSSAHNAYAVDALNDWKMNVQPGRKQLVMHNTEIPLNNPNPSLCGQTQTMVFLSNHPQFPNQPKGMEEILKEQGLWEPLVAAAGGKQLQVVGRCKTCKATAAQREKMLNKAQVVLDENPKLFGSIDNVLEVTQNESLELDNNSINDTLCCMEKCLSAEANFRAEKPLLQLVVEAARHLCILLPKFHCKLIPIEMYWGYAKQIFWGQCNGSFQLAKDLVPKCLDACLVQTICPFLQKTWRYMDAYRKGLTGVMAEHAVKEFTLHQKIAKQIMMEVAMLVM
ncbi:hypothetical protein RHS03_08251, partial [Rhizoctonia solani]